MGKIRGDLFADECPRQVRNLQATIDRVVISNGDVIHPAFEQLVVQLLWIRIAVGKIESPEKPLFRPRTMAGMEMKNPPPPPTFLSFIFFSRFTVYRL